MKPAAYIPQVICPTGVYVADQAAAQDAHRCYQTLMNPVALLRWLTDDREATGITLERASNDFTLRFSGVERIPGCFRAYFKANRQTMVRTLQAEAMGGVDWSATWEAGLLDAWIEGLDRSLRCLDPINDAWWAVTQVMDDCDPFLGKGRPIAEAMELHRRKLAAACTVPTMIHGEVADKWHRDCSALYAGIAAAALAEEERARKLSAFM